MIKILLILFLSLPSCASKISLSPQCNFPDSVIEKGGLIKETFKDTLDTPFVSMHVNTNHLIEITGPDTAKGRVYLLDVITKNMDGSDIEEGKSNFLWFALYDEQYVKVDGEWKVKRMDLHFFWPERHIAENFSTNFV